MDWILIITLVISGGNDAAIQSLEFASIDACETAKETYLAANQSDKFYVSGVCVSKQTVILRR